jgi:hypothetical protein
MARIEVFPCIFRASREFSAFRDGFAPDCPLQRGVWCEPDFRGRIPSMTVGDFANANPGAALARGTELRPAHGIRVHSNCRRSRHPARGDKTPRRGGGAPPRSPSSDGGQSFGLASLSAELGKARLQHAEHNSMLGAARARVDRAWPNEAGRQVDSLVKFERRYSSVPLSS